MTSLLVVVTFMAGATWGPQVSMQEMSTSDGCIVQKARIAKQIASVAQTNTIGGGVALTEDGDTLVVVAANGTREIARLSCW